MSVSPTFQILAGFGIPTVGNNYGVYDVNHYDDGSVYWPDPSLITLDIATRADGSRTVRYHDGVHIQRGATTVHTTSARAEAGTFSCVLDNRDRRFDPTNLAGPYTVGGASKVVPGIRITVKVVYPGESPRTLFTGNVDQSGWHQVYPQFGRDQVVELKATDAIGKLATAQLVNLARAPELTGTRISAILAAVDNTLPTNIDKGTTVASPLTRGTVTAWSTAADTSDAEWGDLYVEPDGTVRFRDRSGKFSEGRSLNPQAVFGDKPTLGELAFSDVTIDDTVIVNDMTVVYNDQGLQVNASDTSSWSQPWGRQSDNRPLPINDAAFAYEYAKWIVKIYGFPRLRFSKLSFKPMRALNLRNEVGLRDLGDRITIKLTPQGGGSRIVRDCWIRGISHDISGVDWTTSYVLEDATATSGTNIGIYDVNHYDDGSVYGL